MSEPERIEAFPDPVDIHEQTPDIVMETLAPPIIDRGIVFDLVRDQRLTPKEKTTSLAAYAFHTYKNQFPAGAEPIGLPDDKTLDEYYIFANYVHEKAHGNTEIEVLLEMVESITNQNIPALLRTIDETLEPFEHMTPLAAAEIIASSEPFFEQPRLAKLMVKLWMVERYNLFSFVPGSFREVKQFSLTHKRKPGGFPRY